MELIVATSNKHKVEEIKKLLPARFVLRTLSEIGFTDPIEENAPTIKGNSLLKAEAVFNFIRTKHSLPGVIADDSGLEVVALDGRPGVRSARYSGDNATDESNNNKLLSELERVNDRRARFVTVITFMGEGEPVFFEGEVKGTIAYESRGKEGFGYDPLFIPQGYRSTFAELGPEVKNQISHRAAAIKRLVEFLKTL
jgi:XTP/dITP diphosphohydrolase